MLPWRGSISIHICSRVQHSAVPVQVSMAPWGDDDGLEDVVNEYQLSDDE
jgi:hypothetical protein